MFALTMAAAGVFIFASQHSVVHNMMLRWLFAWVVLPGESGVVTAILCCRAFT